MDIPYEKNLHEKYLSVSSSHENGSLKWGVSYSNPLGGGWGVTVDAQTGKVEKKGELPEK
jgi:hypothetical protein